MIPSSGWFHSAFADNTGGHTRAVHSHDSTLSRRGLRERADRRARELGALGIGAGSVVGLSMGNVSEYLVLLLAASRLGAVAVPIDAAAGDRLLVEVAGRVPLDVVVRRPRGNDSDVPRYPAGYAVRSRRKLSGSLLTIDVLEPAPELERPRPGVELVLEAVAPGGTMRTIHRTGAALQAIGEAAAAALALAPGSRMVCAQPLSAPQFFDVVVLGWLASGAQLVLAEGAVAKTIVPLSRTNEPLLVVDSLRQFAELVRATRSAGSRIALDAVLPQATIPLAAGRELQAAFGHVARQLLLLEEIGILAVRPMERGQAFGPALGVELRPGAELEIGGREILAGCGPECELRPAPPEPEPGAKTPDSQLRHTGYAGQFGRDGSLHEVIGRNDGLVNLEGRRACLDHIEEVLLRHGRIRWARAQLEHTVDGDPQVHVEYRASGTTALSDLDEHVVGLLPPHMVPRHFTRLDG